MKSSRTSSTGPHIQGITCTPFALNISSSGLETAPHISMSTPSSRILCARLKMSVSATGSSFRLISLPASSSATTSRRATSKTGDTRPAHIGIATFIRRTMCNRRAKHSPTRSNGYKYLYISALGFQKTARRGLTRTAICNHRGLAVLHYAIIYLALISSVPLWNDNAKGTNLTEECAGIDAELLGSRGPITTVAAKCVGYVQSFEGFEC